MERPTDQYQLTPQVLLLETPGHTREDISVAIRTSGCQWPLRVCHLGWNEDGPLEDPYASSVAQLADSRQRIVGLRPKWIIPGHGRPFRSVAKMPVV